MIDLKLCEKCQGILAKRINTLIKLNRKKKEDYRTFMIGQLNYYILKGVPVDKEEAPK